MFPSARQATTSSRLEVKGRAIMMHMRNRDDTELEIGEVARRAGLRPSAVRYYEERGLVTPARRNGRRRVYGVEAVERLALIAFAKKIGFSLDEIRSLL